MHYSVGANGTIFSHSRVIVGLYVGLPYINRISYSTLKPVKPELIGIPPKTKVMHISKSYRKRLLVLTKDLREVLIGLLLGDVCAQKLSAKGDTKLYFERGILHKDYLFYLYELFRYFTGGAPRVFERKVDNRTVKVYTRVQFATFTLPCLNELYEIFYPEGKKIVPKNIEELLTPLGLAY